MPNIKIKKNYFQIVYFFALRWLNRLLMFLALRKSRKYWGVVYDSVSKQPLDPAIVKLVYVGSDEPVQTCVTDLSGRYGFLAEPGKFKIFAKKSNFSFPSNRVTGDDDGTFTDIYRGEFFQLYSDSEVIGPNIPMDPLRSDWNQQAKLKLINNYPFFKLFIKKIIKVFFWFGFMLTVIFSSNGFFQNFPLKSYMTPAVILLIYFFLLLLNSILPNLRLWGRLYNQKGRPIAGAHLEIVNPAIPSITLAKTTTKADGKFLLRVNPGKYILKFGIRGQVTETNINVESEGVVNLNFCAVDKLS